MRAACYKSRSEGCRTAERRAAKSRGWRCEPRGQTGCEVGDRRHDEPQGARAMGREAGWAARSCAGGTASRKAQGLRGQLSQLRERRKPTNQPEGLQDQLGQTGGLRPQLQGLREQTSQLEGLRDQPGQPGGLRP